MANFGTGLRSNPTMGSGLAQGASEVVQLRPIWQQAIADGETNLPFDMWVRQPEVQAQFLSAQKPLPR